jgi:hypothetical protein
MKVRLMNGLEFCINKYKKVNIMIKYIKNFWDDYCLWIISGCVITIAVTLLIVLKGYSNTSRNERYDNCEVTVSEIVINNHSYLRICESDGFSTVRHLVHNPDCSCLK